MALGNHVHEESACPEEYVPSPLSVERVRHSVSINVLVFQRFQLCLAGCVVVPSWLCLAVCMCLAALCSVDVMLSASAD